MLPESYAPISVPHSTPPIELKENLIKEVSVKSEIDTCLNSNYDILLSNAKDYSHNTLSINETDVDSQQISNSFNNISNNSSPYIVSDTSSPFHMSLKSPEIKPVIFNDLPPLSSPLKPVQKSNTVHLPPANVAEDIDLYNTTVFTSKEEWEPIIEACSHLREMSFENKKRKIIVKRENLNSHISNSGTISRNFNFELTEALAKLQHLYEIDADKWRMYSYKKVVGV